MFLTRVALFTAILGTALLLFLSQTLEPKLIKISEINDDVLEQNVKVQGNVASLKKYGNMAIISLEDETEKINVVVYNLKENISFSGKIQVIGKIKEYNNELEIEANKINKIE